MKKNQSLKILWNYLKQDKIKLLLYILLVVITSIPILFNAYFWGKAIEFLVEKNWISFLKYLGLWEGVLILCYTILQAPKEKLYYTLEVNFMQRVSKDLYAKIDKLPAKAFEEIGVGEFINRLHSDTDRVIELLSRLVKLSCKSLVIIAVFIICFKISYILGIEIIVFSIIMGFVSYKFFPKIKETQEKIKVQTDKYIKSATENITGIREIKALGIKNNIENKIFNTIDNLVIDTKKQRSYSVTYYVLNNFIYFVLQFIILFSTGKLLIEGQIAFSVFSMIETYIWRIDEVVESISDFGVSYNKVIVSLNRIDQIINNELYSDEIYGTKELTNVKGYIQFKNVKFKYNEDEENTLKGLNLTIEPHKKIAIVGKSGNGKSTIFNLLLRYFDATEGDITIDNINIKELSENSLRNNISIIRQNPFLFNETVFDNFKLVKEDVSLEEIRDACKKAYIDDYIMSLPNQYDTVIGEGGINLSGGQKQRVAIARTLLLNTKIILFDEATSALDNESQEYIKKTIDTLIKDHTVIIVAHRLSTIIDADIINIIDNGILTDSGNHKDLLHKSKIYKSLYRSENL